ncbi:MAG: VCBS repeat-containing protein, partial [Verrucomicrobia bacterium]|nr:VCBS repeat-containing protein [Verrucomicrobiota bacterium]
MLLVSANLTAEQVTFTQVTEPPFASGNLSFTHWTVNGVRQNAVTGQAKTAFSWTVLGHTTATAHYIPTADDTNTNSIEDWMELRLYGQLLEAGQGPNYDFDDDGIGHAQELIEGTQPTISDQPRDGGLMLRLSGVNVLRDESVQKRYEIRSEPQGVITAVIGYESVGVEKLTQTINYGVTNGYYFGYWEIDGVRQASGSGLALPQARMVMNTDHVAIARFFPAGDSDTDGMEDWREWYWFGTLAQDGSGDPDGDGITTAEELIRGSEPHLHDSLQDGGVMLRLSAVAKVRDETLQKRYEIRSDPQGVIAAITGYAAIGTEQWTQAIAYGATNGYYFGYWEIDGVRQATGSGLALPQARMVMDADHCAIARFFPAGDSDTDGMEDWREWYWFGTLAQDGGGDPDGDGVTTAEELIRGSEPHLHDSLQDGGVMLRLSSMSTLRAESAKKSYEIRSEPQGILAAVTGYADTGTEQWTQAVSYGATSGYYFGYWEVDGVRQASGSGLALSFFPAGDSDTDGMEDWREWYWFGTLAQDGSGDPDGDGVSTANELVRGSEPHLHDTLQDGGIMMRLSAMATKKQYYAPEPMVLIDGVLSEMFASAPYQVDNTLRYADLWENGFMADNAECYPALGDWDGDGDRDFFLWRSDRQLTAYQNIGSSFLVNLSDRTTQFALDDVLADMPTELLGFCLADWDGDGKQDLVFAKPGTIPAAAELVVVNSPGSFETTVGFERVTTVAAPMLESGQQYYAVTAGDINHDGFVDLVAATGGPAGADQVRVFLGSAHGGAFPVTANAQYDFISVLGVSRHISLAISPEQDQAGYGHLYVADTYGTILKIDYVNSTATLGLVRADWAASY